MTLTHNQFVALFGGGADGGEVPSGPVQLSVIFVATQFVFKWKAPATSTVVFHWGDNTTSEVSGNDLTEVITTSSYTSAGTCNVWLTGDVADITYIDVSGQAFVSGDTDTWVAAITGLTHIDVSDTGMTGDASLFAAFSLTTFNFDSSSLTWESNTAMSLTSATVNAASSGMNTTTMVDNFIDSVKAGTGCTYNVAGTNAHRTAASNADLNTLLANGNTITLNDTLGAELHTDANAASDPNGNEADATTGWTSFKLDGTGANVFESQGAVKNVGGFALHTDCNDTPTAAAQINQAFAVDSGSVYRIAFDWRHVGTGDKWGLFTLPLGGPGNYELELTSADTTFTSAVWYFTADAVSETITFRESEQGNSGGMYMDNFSFKKVTLT